MPPATINDETEGEDNAPRVIETVNNGPDIDPPPPINYPVTFSLRAPITVPLSTRVNVGHGVNSSDGKTRQLHELELSAPTARMFMKYGAFQRPVSRERIDPVTREQTTDRFTEVNYPALLNFASDMSGIPLKHLEDMNAVDVERLGAVIVRLMFGIPS